MQTFLIRLSDKYNVCCHDNSCVYVQPYSFKHGTSFQMFLLQWFVRMLSICPVYAIACTSNVEKWEHS